MSKVQLVQMKSPKTGAVYSLLPSKVYAKLNEGWNLVNKDEQPYYNAQVQRIRASLVVHAE